MVQFSPEGLSQPAQWESVDPLKGTAVIVTDEPCTNFSGQLTDPPPHLTVPPPNPSVAPSQIVSLTISLNTAFTFFAAPIFTLQIAPEEVSHPLQLDSTQSASADAVNVISVVSVYECETDEQEPAQLIPGGLLVTEPPDPVFSTESAYEVPAVIALEAVAFPAAFDAVTE